MLPAPGELAAAGAAAETATSLPWLLLQLLLLPPLLLLLLLPPLLPPLKISAVLKLQLVVAPVAAPVVAGAAPAPPVVCSASICCACATHATHGHGPPNFLANMERSLRAGPSFMPSELTRWSSVKSGRPVPSMDWSRNDCNGKRAKKSELVGEVQIYERHFHLHSGLGCGEKVIITISGKQVKYL